MAAATFVWPFHHGSRLAEMREAALLSQYALAVRCGVHPNTIARLESYANWEEVKLKTVLLVVGALGTNLGTLLGSLERSSTQPQPQPQPPTAPATTTEHTTGDTGHAPQ